MSISLRDAVNFAETVQKKDYEKRAAQVDTFVQSETAEQKLARSEKMQTAKAISALAELGGHIQGYRAQQSEQKAQLIQEDLANITAAEIQEQRDGNKPYSSETFLNLPLRFQTKVRSGVGYERGKRLIAEAEANIQDFHLLDDDLRQQHIEKYAQSTELQNGMDAHELVGYNKGWQEGLDRINNAASKAKIAHNRKQVETDYKAEVSYIINEEEMAFDALEDASDAPLSPERVTVLRKQSATRIYTKVEDHFQNYSNDVGIEVPPEVKKRWVREQIIASAKDTDNIGLLLKENRPKEYLDDTSNYLFAQAAIELRDQIESNERADIIAMKAKKDLEVMQGIEDIHNGELTWNTPNKTTAQIQALNNWDALSQDGEGAYASNKTNFMNNVRRSVTMGKNILVGLDDKPILDAAGRQVPLTTEGVQGYVKYNPMFKDSDQGFLIDNSDALLVGFDTAANFPKARIESLLEDAEFKVPESQLRKFIDKEGGKVKEQYRITFAQLRETKGWDKPLTPTEIDTFNNEFVDSWLKGELDALNESFINNNTQVPDLNGEIGGTSTGEDQTVETNDEVETDDNPDPDTEENQFKFEDLNSEEKNAWEQIKYDPRKVDQWKAAGYPTPYKTDEELTELANERNNRMNQILEREGVTNDKIFELVFNEMHHKHGDGFRMLDFGERREFNGLNLSKEETAFLEEQVTHALASDFINSAANKASNSIDSGDWAKWQKYAQDVMENPYNVYKYDDWLEGDETIGMKGTGLDKENILGPAREYDWFDPRIDNKDREYK